MKYFSFVTLLFCCSIISAQYNFTSGSGELKGHGGSASQSVGQIAYTTYQSDSGKISQGVIQPFQISVISGEEVREISLTFNAFPNPTIDFLNLTVENYDSQELICQLIDINGRLISTKNINSSYTEISTSELLPATYFLRVIHKDQAIKTFKIVKISY
jgi:hypothetical protein